MIVHLYLRCFILEISWVHNVKHKPIIRQLLCDDSIAEQNGNENLMKCYSGFGIFSFEHFSISFTTHSMILCSLVRQTKSSSVFILFKLYGFLLKLSSLFGRKTTKRTREDYLLERIPF